METSILTATQRYAAAGLLALALHHSQKRQARPSDALAPLEEEPIGRGASIDHGASAASELPELWIHEGSGLLPPVFRFLKVDERSWDGLKETAGSSSQVRRHVGARAIKFDPGILCILSSGLFSSSLLLTSYLRDEDEVEGRGFDLLKRGHSRLSRWVDGGYVYITSFLFRHRRNGENSASGLTRDEGTKFS